mgnify:CR=1 FL=1
MKIYSWNINGYNTCNQYGGFSEILSDKPDIICLQEEKVADPELLNNFFTMDYEKYYNFSEKRGHNGVFVFSKIAPEFVEYRIGQDRFDKDGRFIYLEYTSFILINIYMPHGGRDKRELSFKLDAYNKLYEYIKMILEKGKPIIIAGDYNIAHTELDVERYNDNRNNIMFTEEEREAFSKLLSLNIYDLFREKFPQKREYTWWPYAFHARQRNVGWRLDYFLGSMKNLNINCFKTHSELYGSDHCPISLEVTLI